MGPIGHGGACIALWGPRLKRITVASVATAKLGQIRDWATYAVVTVDFFYAQYVAVSEQEFDHGFACVRVLFGGPFAFEVYGAPCCVNAQIG